jgi:hypothetical protein
MHALTVVVMRSVLVPLPSFANDRIANTVADLEPAKTFHVVCTLTDGRIIRSSTT